MKIKPYSKAYLVSFVLFHLAEEEGICESLDSGHPPPNGHKDRLDLARDDIFLFLVKSMSQQDFRMISIKKLNEWEYALKNHANMEVVWLSDDFTTLCGITCVSKAASCQHLLDKILPSEKLKTKYITKQLSFFGWGLRAACFLLTASLFLLWPLSIASQWTMR